MDYTMLRQISRCARLNVAIKQNNHIQEASNVRDLFNVMHSSKAELPPILDGDQLAEFFAKRQDIDKPTHVALLQYLKSTGQPWHSYNEFPPPPNVEWSLPPRGELPSQVVLDERTYSRCSSHLGNSMISFYSPQDNKTSITGDIETICRLPLHKTIQTFFIVRPH
jgi:hypothetical protein